MAAMTGLLLCCLICVGQISALEIKEKMFSVESSGKGSFELTVGKEKITVDLMAISEVDVNGTQVPGNATYNPHKVSGLSMKSFMLPMKVKFDNTSKPHRYSFDMSHTIETKDGNASLKIDVIATQSNGTISGLPATQKFNASAGSIFIGVTITKWPFCGEGSTMKCLNRDKKEVSGAYLDFTFNVKGAEFEKKKEMIWHSKGKKKVMLRLSSKSAIDNTPQTISGYPMVKADVITIRFAKFTGVQEGKYMYAQLVLSETKFSGGDRAAFVGCMTLAASFMAYVLAFLL